jgi:hypothetical protein
MRLLLANDGPAAPKSAAEPLRIDAGAHTDTDTSTVPPPPARRAGTPRSASNPIRHGGRPVLPGRWLAAAVLRLAYPPDRFLDAASPGIAMPGQHVLSSDWLKAGQ